MTMWSVHPANQVTNHEFVRRLADSGEGSAGSFELKQLAEDDKRYDVIQVPFRLLKEMYDATEKKSGGDFAFIPFKRERSDETLKFVPEFLLEKSKNRKVRAAIMFVKAKQAEAAAAATSTT